ncbi:MULTISPECIES: AMP-binding protein [unclassified Spirosoma]|uniref:AMP-binding protein n=1 Tax=unclassified Spirosoma TaxID=2621999 RepID=UPI000963892F|nr:MULTISPECIES: AMP-binding protein [unclassified Spirosoma]MBN8824581.1 AMP-binding protein [Spirosoma sp.]OJW70942.1 MAG: long-chain-fatty-acid--CoA ligase [Spirosoma sp. 48-14]
MNTQSAIDRYPWRRFYPKEVPYEINPDAYTSLVALFEEGCQRFANRPAYACMGKQITFGELNELANQFASFLQNGLHLQKGDRLAIQMPNTLQYPVAMFGALKAGLVVVNTNPLYTPREMQHQFKDSGAKAIVILANFASNLEKILDRTDIQHVIVTQLGDLLGFPKKQIVNAVVKYVKKLVPAYKLPDAISFNDALSQGSKQPLKPVTIQNTDLAFIQYTGGTTGVSKGAMLTHRNIIANVECQHYWMKPGHIPDGEGIIVAALPLYHVYALTTNALAALKSGAMNLLITNPRDLNAFIDDLKKYQITAFTGVNTLYNGLLNHPRINEVDFSHLKVTSAGGMALQTAVAERWAKLTGNTPCEGYGLTETSPVLSSNPVDGTVRVGTIGIPWPSTEMKVIREDGTDAPLGEPGEIVARGPQVFKGYYNRPEETAKSMMGDWFKTGDVAVMNEDGFFKIVDRKKDMILVSGFNVYPNEIEDVVAQCPGVLEVACIGIPDEKSTEVVKIFVVKKDPNLTVESIKEFCRENLTPYKVPRVIEFRTELPKSNVGKILRRPLRDEELAKLKK